MSIRFFEGSRSLIIPKAIEITDLTISGLGKEVVRKAIENKNSKVCVASGKRGSAVVAGELGEVLAGGDIDVSYHKVIDSSVVSCIDLEVECSRSQSEVIVAVGGGTVIDVAKVVASRRNIILVVIPTCLSSDCVASPVSVVRKKDGRNSSIPTMVPHYIYINIPTVKSAPVRLNRSGFGDAMSNHSAVLDWVYAAGQNSAEVDGFAKLLSTLSIETFEVNDLDFASNRFIKKLAESLLVSGLSMGFSGDSRPASGAEHLISHAIDFYGCGKGLHGEQVAVAMLYLNELRKILGEEAMTEKALELVRFSQLPSNPEVIKISKEEFLNCVKHASKMRPERMTILNHSDLCDSVMATAYDFAFGGVVDYV